MSIAVMQSIRPKWCDLIFERMKSLEVRKTRPMIPLPFKTYIYCTKPRYEHEDFFVIDAGTENWRSFYGGGKVVGEYVCDRIFPFYSKSVLRKDTLRAACMSLKDFEAYRRGGMIYLWHISELVIYDEPREIGDFSGTREPYLKRPPQSWCYVAELDGT